MSAPSAAAVAEDVEMKEPVAAENNTQGTDRKPEEATSTIASEEKSNSSSAAKVIGSAAAVSASSSAEVKKGDETEEEEDEYANLFVKFPSVTAAFVHRAKWLKDCKDKGRDGDFIPFRLPKTMDKEKAAIVERDEKKKAKKAGDAAVVSEADAKEDLKLKQKREAEKAKEKEKKEMQKYKQEDGLSVQESFNKLVKQILVEESSSLSSDKNAWRNSLYQFWEIPYIAHFTLRFQKPLQIRPIEPYRLEEIIHDPHHILNESQFSEFVSKLLFATRVNFTSHYKKSLTFMGKNQRCFDYELISDWMMWLIEIWIEQSKLMKKEEEEELAEEEAGEDEDGEAGARTKKGGASSAAARNRGRRADTDSESDLSDEENEDDDEKEAYNLHLLSDRKWRIDAEELFDNVNPFTVPEAGSAEAAAESSASSTAAASSATAAASSSADGSASTNGEPTTPPVVIPVRRRSFHQLSLAHRCTILKLLCDFQVFVNPFVLEHIKTLESKESHVEQWMDCSGKKYMYFGFGDYRIYVQNTAEWIAIPKSKEEIAATEAKKAEFEKAVADEVERLKRAMKEKEAGKASASTPSKRKKEESTEPATPASSKKLKTDVKTEDEPMPAATSDAQPLSSPKTPSSTIQPIKIEGTAQVPISSLSLLSSPNGKSAKSSPTPSTPAPAASSTSTPMDTSNIAAGATPVASTPAPSTAKKSPEPAMMYEYGLPFPQRAPENQLTAPRTVAFDLPPAPTFSLLTQSAEQMKALIKRLNKVDDKRNKETAEKIKKVLEDIDSGNGRIEEDPKPKSKKDAIEAPKRVSDRLVSLEAQREEQERARAIRFEEESRARNTRRSRWLQAITLKNLMKLRRSYEKLMGIKNEKKKPDEESTADEDDDEEEEEDDESSNGGGRASRNRSSSRGARSGGRVTRNRGKPTKSLREVSETETEDEEEEEEDDGCVKCQTVVPPEDGSNPILLCDKCDAQYCMKCVPLERLPLGKFFCPECVAKNPRIR